VQAQLRAGGVETISRDDTCTVEDARYYSHRRDGDTGRFAVVATLVR
jgi:copper oxidase (laccase) domain-containing protein